MAWMYSFIYSQFIGGGKLFRGIDNKLYLRSNLNCDILLFEDRFICPAYIFLKYGLT